MTLGSKVNELVDFGPNVGSLCCLVSTLSDSLIFATQLAQDVFPYLMNIQSNKGELHTSALLQFVQSKAAALDPDQSGDSPWDIIGAVIKRLTKEASDVLPLALEVENVKKCTFLYSRPEPLLTLISLSNCNTSVDYED